MSVSLYGIVIKYIQLLVVGAAPAIFQKLVDNLVSGIPYVAAYQDDVIVTGRTKEEHLQNLRQVLAALTEYGMKLRLDKCEFFQQHVTYLVS